MTTQLKNKLTGLVSETTEQHEFPPTWQTHVVIPLTQNVVGGLAVAAVCAVVTVGLGRYFLWRVIVDELAMWSFLAGALVASLATVVRFFGDDLGIVAAAYRAGRRSADTQISALVGENQQLRATARELRGESSHRSKDMLAAITKAQSDAEGLLSLAYGGQSIAREKVSAYMPQRSWERAMQLMRAAGCLTSDGGLVDDNLGAALKRLRTYVAQDTARAQGGHWFPKWFVESRRGAKAPKAHVGPI